MTLRSIALVHPTLAYQGGAELTLIWLTQELVRRGIRTALFTGAVSPSLQRSIPRQVKIVHAQRGAHPNYWREMPTSAIHELQHYDVVNVHNFPSYLWLAKNEAELPPVVFFCQEPPQRLYASVTQRDFFHQFYRRWRTLLTVGSHLNLMRKVLFSKIFGLTSLEQRAVRKCKCIIANSAFTADNVDRIYHRLASVCHLGIPSYFSAIGTTEGKKNPGIQKQILVPGRLSAIKNIETVLLSIRKVQKSEPKLLQDCGVTLIGEGWQKKMLQKRIKRHGLERKVTIHDLVSHREMQSVYENHQLVLYIPYDEPFGLVSIEAMATGKPVIGARQGGIQESVVHKKTGLLVQPNDSNEVAQALVSLLSNPSKCRDFGESGRKRYFRYYTMRRFTDRFQGLLERGIVASECPAEERAGDE